MTRRKINKYLLLDHCPFLIAMSEQKKRRGEQAGARCRSAKKEEKKGGEGVIEWCV